MINRIKIVNFGIIETLETDFQKGFNVITGDTGSGKSLVLDAIGLVLGNKVDNSFILNKNKETLVEIEFNVFFDWVKEFLSNNNIQTKQNLILRREISTKGKSRCFINDSFVSLDSLSILSNKLIDLHSQYDHQFIHSYDLQLALLDYFCGHKKELENYKSLFLEHKKYKKEQKELEEKREEYKEKNHLNEVLEKELNEIDFLEEDFFEMERKYKEQVHFKEIKSSLKEALFLIDQKPSHLLDQLYELSALLEKISSYSKDNKELPDRIGSMRIELLDIRSELNLWDDSLIYDLKEYELIEEQLSKVYVLERKHQVTNFKELLEIKERLNKETNQIKAIDEKIEVIQTKLSLIKETLAKQALYLEEKRKKFAKILEKNIQESLKELEMPYAKIFFEIISLKEFNEKGINKVKIHFSANQGASLNELSKIASGGEQSRIMLAVKYFSSSNEEMSSLILDEIDVGVSGKTTYKMSEMIKKIAQKTQVIAISHQAQLVAKADYHLKIHKKIVNEKTATFLKKLNQKERIEEIAQMISGEKVTQLARLQAGELLEKH